jgi:nicotinic acid mononucleotide adenylyltransferase
MRLRQIFEAPATAVMAFGRMNPPTIGHAKLVDAIKSQSGDPFIFLSQSQKPKTDPLSFEDKLRYANTFFPGVTIGHPEVKTIIQALQKVESLGYQDLIYVAGSDRVQAFDELLNKYNGKDFTFKSIKVVSAGERDPDADGAEGMSASKMRQAAVDNDIESFKQGVPQQELADEMFAAVRAGMGIAEGLVEYTGSVTQSRPKIEVLQNIADRKDSNPFPLSYKDTGGASSGGLVYVTPKQARRFIGFFEKRASDEQELIRNQLKSAERTKKLFRTLQMDVILKQDKISKSEKERDTNPLDDLLGF